VQVHPEKFLLSAGKVLKQEKKCCFDKPRLYFYEKKVQFSKKQLSVRPK
tara:strand:+ start:297 stop:443 length:147 start_codon:yes stop_codon:yes gene_type:complete